MIDERALQAAAEVLADRFDDATSSKDLAALVIEAYEAALWRPIEEMPRDGRERLVRWGKNRDRVGYETIWWSDIDGWWMSGQEKVPPGPWLTGAMFRTITPPPQNAACSSLQASPEADDVSGGTDLHENAVGR